MTDLEIVEALIARDEQVTRLFFFQKCRPLFCSIIKDLFQYHPSIDYDELVSMLYLELLKNDAKILRQYSGRSSIYYWMKTVAIRFFQRKRDEIILNGYTDENDNAQNLSDENDTDENRPLDNGPISSEEEYDNLSSARMMLDRLLGLMPNQRYAKAIRRLAIDEAAPQTVAQELGVTVDNLYNIKKRAFDSLTQIALKHVKDYE
jgi:RNA polymerase sigma factor (sigma-70 family)